MTFELKIERDRDRDTDRDRDRQTEKFPKFLVNIFLKLGNYSG